MLGITFADRHISANVLQVATRGIQHPGGKMRLRCRIMEILPLSK